MPSSSAMMNGPGDRPQRPLRQVVEVQRALALRVGDLAPAGVPVGDGEDDLPGGECGDEGVDLRQLDQQRVEQSDDCSADQAEKDHQAIVHALQLPRQRHHLPQADTVADRQVDLAGHHRHRDGEGEDEEHGLARCEQLEVQQRGKGVGTQRGEDDEQDDGQDHHAVVRRELVPEARARAGLERRRFERGVHRHGVTSLVRARSDAAATRFEMVTSSPSSSATI